MLLHFCYIEGISRIDTPNFVNINEQEDYFDSHEIVVIENTFYPPHYLNKIKVDSEDISFNTNVNYLWFEYNDKRYYYFIDDVEYISETVAYIHITMDTIQTYMFNVKISNGVIERMFIDRYITTYSDTINRSYIRENVSNSEFGVGSYTIVNNEYRNWVYVMKATKVLSASEGSFIHSAGPASSGVGLMNESTIIYTLNIPYAIYFSYNLQYFNEELIPNNIPTEGDTFPETSEIFLVPFEPFDDISIDASYRISGRVSVDTRTAHSASIKFLYQTNWMYHSKVNKNSTTFGFTHNRNICNHFTWQYIPQLLDENFIHFTFGDNTYCSEYPLHLLTTTVVYLAYWADIASGCRYYNISPDTNNLLLNTYNTIVKNPSPLALDTKNEAWELYNSRNKNALMSAMVGDVGNYTAIAGQFVSAGNDYTNNLRMVANNDKYWDRRYKTPHLKNKYRDSITRMRQNYDSDITSATYSAASRLSSTLGYWINRDNLMAAPPMVKQTGDASRDMANGGWYIGYRNAKCIDFEQCANYFHRNGNLVNKYINSIPNIFQYVNSRHYFNVLKMLDVDLHLSDVIEDDTSLESIKDRLKDGLRLWNNCERPINFTNTYRNEQGGIPGSTVTFDVVGQGIYIAHQIITENKLQVISTSVTQGEYSFSLHITARLLTGSATGYSLFYQLQSKTHDKSIIIGDFTYDNVEKSQML